MFFPLGQFTDDFGDDRPTWPPPGTRNMDVEDRCEVLFTSATWTIVLVVDGEVIASSEPGSCHPPSLVSCWTRQAIRTCYAKLRQLGVDAEAEYIRAGGKLEDLKA